jgi:CRP-like cAMP-binding protein/flavin-dependent dehydrogenase
VTTVASLVEGSPERVSPMELEDGSRVGVIGGGPAGSLFAYFLLTFARRADLALQVDIFEPRDFCLSGPAGCNMCGGIVSETLVQALAAEGVTLPSSLVQRGIDSYVLHTADGRLPIETPLHEKRIAAIHRGGGPRDAETMKWGGLDGYLLDLARSLGAELVRARVGEVGWTEGGRPEVRLKKEARAYDLLVGATGVNSNAWPVFEKLGLPARPPRTAKTFVTELNLGQEAISRHFGDAMHLFLLDIPKLDCAAMVPKGDYVTVCLLGAGIDGGTIEAFFQSGPVRRFLPPELVSAPGRCHCGPRINEREAAQPFIDRVVLVGDCGVSRLYKDGIGAAYRTAKCAARTAVFSGVASDDFRRHYWPLYRSIANDNRYGVVMFATVHLFKAFPPLLRGAMGMAGREQRNGGRRRMSLVLWDMFTGSAPYRDIFFRTLDPRFLGGLALEVVRAVLGRPREEAVPAEDPERDRVGVRPAAEQAEDEARRLDDEEAGMDEGVLGRVYADGEVLCRQGETGDRMFVIQSGHVEVLGNEGGQEVRLGELGPGEVFGHMAIVDKKPRSATVRVRGSARVLTLDKRAFLRRVHEDPALAYKMLEMMSGTVRSLDDELTLLRNAGQVKLVRYVYVVPREKPELYEQLSREFGDDPEVEVVMERRRGERRRSESSHSPERRRWDRRVPDDPWTVHLSLPYRRGRGRPAVLREGSRG